MRQAGVTDCEVGIIRIPRLPFGMDSSLTIWSYSMCCCRWILFILVQSYFWSSSRNANKCKVLHLGTINENFDYSLDGAVLSKSNCERDLGVLVSSHRRYGISFSDHCTNVVKRAHAICSTIQRAFDYRKPSFLCDLFKVYARPIVEYASPIWSPFLSKDINAVESVQRRFTSWLPGLRELSYEERLRYLH